MKKEKTLHIVLFISIFAISTILTIVAKLLGFTILIYIFKPLIVLPLLVIYLLNKEEFNIWVILALCFGWGGDVALMFAGQFAFTVGLVFFLLGHIFYILALSKYIKKPTIKQILPLSIPLTIYGIIAFFGLKLPIGIIFFAVLAYLLVSLVMNKAAFSFMLSKKNITRIIAFVSALLFLISDTILAFQVFVVGLPIFGVLVMITYSLAQLGLSIGLTEAVKNLKEKESIMD